MKIIPLVAFLSLLVGSSYAMQQRTPEEREASWNNYTRNRKALLKEQEAKSAKKKLARQAKKSPRPQSLVSELIQASVKRHQECSQELPSFVSSQTSERSESRHSESPASYESLPRVDDVVSEHGYPQEHATLMRWWESFTEYERLYEWNNITDLAQKIILIYYPNSAKEYESRRDKADITSTADTEELSSEEQEEADTFDPLDPRYMTLLDWWDSLSAAEEKRAYKNLKDEDRAIIDRYMLYLEQH